MITLQTLPLPEELASRGFLLYMAEGERPETWSHEALLTALRQYTGRTYTPEDIVRYSKYVISKANRDVHAKFLLKNGADEVIYPDRDIAENLAKRCSADHVFDYMELDEDYSIYEIPVLQEWIGHSMKELNLRAKYRINIIGTKQEEKSNILPDPDYVFCQGEHLMVLGKNEDVEKILNKI